MYIIAFSLKKVKKCAFLCVILICGKIVLLSEKDIMNQKALKTLEYDKIINLLTEHADSDPGKELCRHLLPSIQLQEIQKSQPRL